MATLGNLSMFLKPSRRNPTSGTVIQVVSSGWTPVRGKNVERTARNQRSELLAATGIISSCRCYHRWLRFAAASWRPRNSFAGQQASCRASCMSKLSCQPEYCWSSKEPCILELCWQICQTHHCPVTTHIQSKILFISSELTYDYHTL